MMGLLIFCNSNDVKAQPEERMQRFKDEKIKFFNERLALSDDQAEKFWPVYEDLHNRNMKINDDERSLLTYYMSNFEAMSEKEVDETISKFMAFQDQRQALSSKYHEEFIKIIGKKKTMQMYALEREFRVYLIETFKGNHGEGSGRGRYRGGPQMPQ